MKNYSPDKIIGRKYLTNKRDGEEDSKEQESNISRNISASSDLEISDETVNEIRNIRSSSGFSLDSFTRQYMESRFGFDFGRVRIHVDANAARTEESVNVHAYTVGNDIVFGQGQYSPHTKAGQRLIAHELTHTIQQNTTGIPHILQRQPRRPITQIELYKDLDIHTWYESVGKAIEYEEQRKVEEAKKEYLKLYRHIISLAEVSKVISNTDSINLMKNKNDIQPGLNFSLNRSEHGSTGFVTRGTQKGFEKLNTTKKSDAPQEVAIILYSGAFKKQKKVTLGIMVHEMLHAKHAINSLNRVKKFRDSKDTNFKDWLKTQKKLTKLESFLIEEDVKASTLLSEILRYTEGFMNMFHLSDLRDQSSTQLPFAELEGTLENQ